MAKCTYIDGVASSQAIDTAGEIVDIAGLDCSSLLGAAFNFEHKSDVPAQIVGKVLEFKKIFSDKDCDTDRQKYYWGKVGMPFLYVLGRLFDDKKESSKEIAALFMDDAENPTEPKMLGFSIEGAKVNKEGMVINRSIARKVTITNMPANKTCVAEMIPAKSQKNINDPDSLFKGEIEFFSPNAKYLEFLEKREKDISKTADVGLEGGMGTLGLSEKLKKDVGTGGGAFIGSQMAMSELAKAAPDWSHKGGGHFSHPEHGTVSVVKQPTGEFHVKHNGAMAGLSGKKAVFGTAHEAGAHAGNYMRSVSQKKVLAPSSQNRTSPQMPKSEQSESPPLTKPYSSDAQRRWAHTDAGKKALGGEAAVHEWDEATKGKKLPERVGKMEKALDAGSAMGAPSTLTQGAALGKESLDKRTQNVHSSKKSKWLARAEQAYKTWEKREEFRSFMQKSMPTLTRGEIDAIGQVIALRKSIEAEKSLSKYASYYLKNEKVDKGSDVLMATEEKK